jgi:hypothetical protein
VGEPGRSVVRKGGVHQEIKSRLFGRIDRARPSFYGGRLAAGYDYESNQAISCGVRERKRGLLNGLMNPFLSFVNKRPREAPTYVYPAKSPILALKSAII